MARSRGQETQRASHRITFSFNRLTLTPCAPIFVYKRSAGVSSRRAGCPNCRPALSVSYWPIGRPVTTKALRAVFPRVYNELRRVAHRSLQKERPGHTLQSAALVHEAYLRLEKRRTGPFENREHFIAICAQLMRQILVERARRFRAHPFASL